MPYTLPAEIQDHIIDFLYTDPAALRACALASRRWRKASQYHIFRSVTITSEATLDRFADLTRSQPRGPIIASYVRELRLNAKSHWKGYAASQAWVTRVAVRLGPALAHIDTLHFEYIEWDQLRVEPATFLEFATSFACVSALHLHVCNFATFKDFENLVIVFQQLAHLALDIIAWRDDPAAAFQQPVQLRLQLRLRSIHVRRYCTLHAIASWLMNTPSRASLTSVKFDTVDATDARAVGQLLRLLGRNLLHVKIGCKFDLNIVDALRMLGDFVDLKHNQNLRSLHMRVLDLQDAQMSWVPLLLAQAAGPAGMGQAGRSPLERVTFDVWLYDHHQLNVETWGEIAWMLGHPNFAGLRRVRFVHRGAMDAFAAARAITARFEGLARRGILRISDGRE